MNAKHFAATIATALCAVGFFSFGYWRGKHDEKAASVRFNLANSLHLYAVANRETSEKLKGDLSFLVYSFTQDYTNYIGENAVPADFREQFAQAQVISKQVETNLVMLRR